MTRGRLADAGQGSALGLAAAGIATIGLVGCGVGTAPGQSAAETGTGEPEQHAVTTPTGLPCEFVESTDVTLELGPTDELAPSEEAAVTEWLYLEGAGTVVGLPPGTNARVRDGLWHRTDEAGQLVAILRVEQVGQGFYVQGIEVCAPGYTP